MHDNIQPVRFISEPITVEFEPAPVLEKKAGCPHAFSWRDHHYRVVEMLGEWHDYQRRGRMARNMRAEHATRAAQVGSWGVGRDYFRVRVHTNQIFELYYDRAPQNADQRKGSWILYRELEER
jgi:hypothetical protein